MFHFAFGNVIQSCWQGPLPKILTHSQDALSLPEASYKGDGISQRESSGDSVSIIPLQGCPHTSAKTQRGAFTRAPSLPFQRYPLTQAPHSEVGLQ